MDCHTFDRKYQTVQCLKKGWVSYRSKNLVTTYQIKETDFGFFFGKFIILGLRITSWKKNFTSAGDFLIIHVGETEI